jgi:predicted nucleic acid-binding protein
MIVIADTSPLNYLILIEQVDILKSLYGTVIIPPAVNEELLNPAAPARVREWAQFPPTWLEIQNPGAITLSFTAKLDPGEREAIALAHKHAGSLLVIDEVTGRQEAQHQGLKIIGTLGILRDAHLAGLLDLPEAIMQLRSTTFQASSSLLKTVLDSVQRH